MAATATAEKNGTKATKAAPVAGPPDPIPSRWRRPPMPKAVAEAGARVDAIRAECAAMEGKARDLRGRLGLLNAELETVREELRDENRKPNQRRRKPSEVREAIFKLEEEIATLEQDLDAKRDVLIEERADCEALRADWHDQIIAEAKRHQREQYREAILCLRRLDLAWRSIRDAEREARDLGSHALPAVAFFGDGTGHVALGCCDRVNERAWEFVEQCERNGARWARDVAAETRATVEAEEKARK